MAYFLDIITDAGRELLEFQCFLHPAVALDSLIESDGVKHNKGDDLMGLQCLLLLTHPKSSFSLQTSSLLMACRVSSRSFSTPEMERLIHYGL